MNSASFPPAPRPASPKTYRILAYAVFGAALLLLLLAGGLYLSARGKLADWSQAEGRVVELVCKHSHTSRGRHSTSYHPRFEFTASDGRRYTVTNRYGSNPPDYDAGDSLPILYPANSPDKAVLNTFEDLYELPLILGGASLLMLLMSGLFYCSARRVARAQQ